MKQAILITVYQDVGAVKDILKYFNCDFNFYIHIDKKSALECSDFNEFKNVYVTKKFKVNWGGVNHLKSILHLSSIALENKENSYFHLITGQDFPVLPLSNFKNLDFSINYLEYFLLPNTNWTDSGGIGRLTDFNLYDFFNAKKKSQLVCILLLKKSLKLLGIKRSNFDSFSSLFGGSTYWSLNREVLDYVISYTSQYNFLESFNYTFCAEEFYFQTILLNSKYSATIINDNKRYIDWSGDYPPKFLVEDDFDKIAMSDNFFARKFHGKLSASLKEKIKKNLGQ